MSRRYADTAFEDFWRAYPRKVGKLAAKREWDRIRPTKQLILRIAETLAWQIEQWTDPHFIPHPRTWLHQGRWDDEPDAPSLPKVPTPNNLTGIASWMSKRVAGE